MGAPLRLTAARTRRAPGTTRPGCGDRAGAVAAGHNVCGWNGAEALEEVIDMTLDEVKAYLGSKPGATEETPFGPEALVYKVGGKIFAVVGWDRDPLTISLKGEPERIEELREVFRSITPAPYFHKRHWNQVRLDGTVPEAEVFAMIDDSYELILRSLPRARRERVVGAA